MKKNGNRKMKKHIALLCAAALGLCLLSGCGKGSDSTIEVFVGENSFGYTVTGVESGADGTTTVKMEMLPMTVKDGDVATNVMTLMQIGSSFAMMPYLVIDGQRVDVPDDKATMGIGGTEDGKLKCVYTFIFDTADAPNELWIYPSGRSDDKDWHYKIDPETFKILERAAIEAE